MTTTSSAGKKELIDTYRFHPRVLELRLVLIYDLMVSKFGAGRADNAFKSLSEFAFSDFYTLKRVINQYTEIKQLKLRDFEKYRQEVLFMGMMWGESKGQIAHKYLKISRSTLYTGLDTYNYLRGYITQGWLESLDKEVVMCGDTSVALEVEQFLVNFDALIGVFK